MLSHWGKPPNTSAQQIAIESLEITNDGLTRAEIIGGGGGGAELMMYFFQCTW